MELQNISKEIQYYTVSILIYDFNSVRKLCTHQDNIQNLTGIQDNCRLYYSCYISMNNKKQY